MDKRESFKKQLTIADMQAKRAQSIMDRLVNDFTSQVDIATDREIVKILQSMGYENAREGMSIEEAEEIHAQMKLDGKYLNISKELDAEQNYIVRVHLVECIKELKFKMELPTEEEIKKEFKKDV